MRACGERGPNPRTDGTPTEYATVSLTAGQVTMTQEPMCQSLLSRVELYCSFTPMPSLIVKIFILLCFPVYRLVP